MHSLLHFTPLPKDLCHIIVEYLDCRPTHLVCTEGRLNRSEADYLRSKGVTILPDSTDIERLSTAVLGTIGTIISYQCYESASRDSRRVLLKWYHSSSQVVVCDPKLGEHKVYSPGISMLQLGSTLLRRHDNNRTSYCKLEDKADWIDSCESSIVCKDVDCCLYWVTLRMVCYWSLPLYNDCLYELRNRDGESKLYKRVSIDRDLKLTCHVKSTSYAPCGTTHYALDRENGVVYCLSNQRFLKFDFRGNRDTDSDAISAMKLADWKRSPLYIYAFEVYSNSTQGYYSGSDTVDTVSIVVLSGLGFDRYDPKTDRWTYDNHPINGHCSMVAM